MGRLEERERAAAQYAERELKYYTDKDGSLVIRARLPAEEGAVVLQALNAAMEAQNAELNESKEKDVTAVTSEAEPGAVPENLTEVTSFGDNPVVKRRADALVTMAETALQHQSESLSLAERYQVVVQVTAETLSEDHIDCCELDNGQPLAPDTARRMACDGSITRMTEDEAGNPLDIGRKTRAAPPSMRRALQVRDGGCRFPGCTQHRFVDAHHIRHWADGGETSIDNLVLLCRYHHRLVHEGGFGVERTREGKLRFRRPDGRIIEEHPRITANGSVEGLRRSVRQKGAPLDAASWKIPNGPLD